MMHGSSAQNGSDIPSLTGCNRPTLGEMPGLPLLRAVDAVTVPVPDLDQGLQFYRDRLGHELLWRNDAIGQAGLRLPDADTELVLTTSLPYGPQWLVASADDATAVIRSAGGRVITEPFDGVVGRIAVVTDPFGNALALLDLSKGTYRTDSRGDVIGLQEPPPA
jgi:predicted enzyme related to lactoylglutathione lyase